MKILFVGDSPTVSTGFGVVAEYLLRELHKHGHEITVLGINHFGEPYDQAKFPYPIYPCDRGDMNMIYGYAKTWWLAQKVEPDLIFFLNDPWVIEKYLQFKSDDFPKTVKFMCYYPIDAGPLRKRWAEMLETKFDAQVCYSTFAENIVTEALGHKPKNLYQIYHGVDKKDYFPINQSIARVKLGIPLNAFIVGMVARNQYRKRFDLLCQGFGKFAQDKEDVKLYLHTALEDVGYDIVDLAAQNGLDGKLILTEDLRPDHGVPKEMLNYIYNTLDVHALISLGDGFGLPVAESMATGVPQLVSDHSCLKELVEGSQGGLLVKNVAWIMNTAGVNTNGGVSDVDDIAEKLQMLYDNKEARLQMAENAYKYITQDKFDWITIGNQFNRVIKDIFHIL